MSVMNHLYSHQMDAQKKNMYLIQSLVFQLYGQRVR